MVRRQQRDYRAPRSWLLRRLHPPCRAGSISDTDDQQHLLCDRRSDQSALSRFRHCSPQVGTAGPPNGLLIVQGPLTFDMRRRVWGIFPGLENGAIDSSDAHLPTLERFASWVKTAVGWKVGPNWVFVKVHTHGALKAMPQRCLVPSMERFPHGHQPRLQRRHTLSPPLRHRVRNGHAGESGRGRPDGRAARLDAKQLM